MSTKNAHFQKHIFIVCEFYEKDARFPRVEFVDFPNNSLDFNEKRTNSLNVHGKHIISEKKNVISAKMAHVSLGYNL